MVMFMRNNRAKNGAPQPEKTASSQSSDQRSERRLSTNPSLDGSPDDLRFSPSMSSCAAINDAHYSAGVSGLGPYGTSYEQNIPYIGKGGNAVAAGDGDRKLSNP
jgi:hypothetical protein